MGYERGRGPVRATRAETGAGTRVRDEPPWDHSPWGDGRSGDPATHSFGASVACERRRAYRGGNDRTFRLRDEEPFTDEEVEELEALAAKIGKRAAHLYAGEQELLEWVAEFDRRKGWKLDGHRSCTDWLAFWTGMDPRTARARVQVARALEGLPGTKEAMRSGRLSFSKVRAIARLGRLEGADEETIVEFAEQTTAVEVEKLVRRRRTLSRVDEAERERRRHASRKLAVFPDDQGMYEVHGRLDPEVGALLMRAVEAASDALYGVEREEPLGPEPPEAEQRRADAIGLLAERALAAGLGATGNVDGPDDEVRNGPAGPRGGGEGEEDGVALVEAREQENGTDARENGPAEPPGERVHENRRPLETDGKNGPAGPRATAPSAARHACTCGGHPAPVMGTRAEHYQVLLHLDPEALVRTGEPRHTHLEDGTRLTAETALRLTCDGAVVPVLENEEGSVLDVGRRTRVISPALRRALRLRDGGCLFPGCGLRFTEGHHVVHWSEGGETCMANVASLCRAHHRAVHEDGFRIEARGDGTFRFFSPEGWPLGNTPPRMEVELDDPAVELVRSNRRRGVSPRWDDPSARYRSESQIPDALLFRAWEAAESG